ncbi:MAG TPA: methyl-accepting chemotaxis protein [Anaeromyxobacteraceae bacterium]|nr:methyl-accepting chemotaxis protein [Anaeromyxobacteraceae bacterium]
MPHLRRLTVEACAAVLGLLVLGLLVCVRAAPLTPAQADALRAAVPLAAIVSAVAAGAVLLAFSRRFHAALDRGGELERAERRRAAVRALRFPSRFSFVVLGLGAAFVAVLIAVLLRAGLPPDLAAAGAAAGLAFVITAAMLVYSAAATNLARALVALGPVDIRERGTVRGKVLVVGFGLIAVTALLLGAFSYACFRVDADEAHVSVTKAAVARAAPLVEAGSARQAVDALGAAGIPAVVLGAGDEPGERAHDGASLRDVQRRGPPVEATRDGWIVRHDTPRGTLVAFASDKPLRERRHEFATSAGLVLVALLLTSLLLVEAAARTISVPLDVLGRAADRIASGDLTASPANVTRDEMGQLASDFRRMVHGLSGLVVDVQSAAGSVNDGARETSDIGSRVRAGALEEHRRFVAVEDAVEAMQGSVSLVSRGVDALSDYVASTSAAVGEMAAALEEVGRQGKELDRLMEGANAEVDRLSQAGRRTQTKLAGLDETATHASVSLGSVSSSLVQLQSAADESQATAHAVAELAETSGVVVEEAVAGMESLRQAVDDAKRRVTALGRRSDDIDQILDFVGEVAGRTNLLSLNASIIATQAGEHGKAFAVVADQIHELASQIASSSNSIGEIIRAVRDDVSGTARLIDRGDALAAQGVAMARKSLGALREIRGATVRARDTSAAIQVAVQAHAKASAAVADLVSSVAENSRSVGEAIQMVGRSVSAVGSVSRGVGTLADRVTRALEEQSGIGRQQLENLERINGMIAEITTAVDAHENATRNVRELLAQLDRTARAHEAAVAELAGVADRLGGRSRALAERVGRFKI